MNRTKLRILSHSVAMCVIVFTAIATLNNNCAVAQGMPIMRHNGEMEPGMVGRERALLMKNLRGHFQSVELFAPEGANIWLIDGAGNNGSFVSTGKSRVTVGMLIGEVYRVKVTGIPDREGEEIFPSIEVINRLYTPGGKVAEFAVPVQLAKDDLQTSLDGGYITRVVYLEDPRTALPAAEVPGEQLVTDIGHREDPLHAADRLGRPMAILRLGSRVPDIVIQQGERGFAFGCPPLRFYAEPVGGDRPAVEMIPREDETRRRLIEPNRIQENPGVTTPRVDPTLGGDALPRNGSPIDSRIEPNVVPLPIGQLPAE